MNHLPIETHPETTRGRDFDGASGSLLERLVFNARLLILTGCAVLTILLGISAARIDINASFVDMMPTSHPYIQNYLEHAESLRGLGNSVRIVVENTSGDIYDPTYLAKLRAVNDRVFLIPGVDRGFMKSLWTPVVRWNEITAEGYAGGPVMPDTYDGTAESIETLKVNVRRSGILGSLVANDERSSMIFTPLLDRDGVTGEKLDYKALHDRLEEIIAMQDDTHRIRIIGFAQLAGDLMIGLSQVLTYFFYAIVIAVALIFAYTRCLRSTLIVVTCSLIAVVWQLGIMHLLGLALDPYSMLVPFLIFAIGVSHGTQKMNGIMQDIGRGNSKYVAARYTFRRLILAGLTALLANAVGFAVLMLIDIPVIRGLAFAASLGVAVLIVTNLILVPLGLSYVGVNKSAAARSLRATHSAHPVAGFFVRFTGRRWAIGALVCAGVLSVLGLGTASQLKVGDLDPGAPELRQDSRYNIDNAYVTSHYTLSSDQFAVIVATSEARGIQDFATLLEMDRLEEQLRDIPGVQTTVSWASLARQYTAAGFEGSPKWMTINRYPPVLNDALTFVNEVNPELGNNGRTVAAVVAYLADHKAETLERVRTAVEGFAIDHNTPERKFLLAAGSAGIEATTNIVVEKANRLMLLYVYLAVVVLSYIAFRSWRAVLVALIPLAVTSILCEALMVLLGIGLKVATLPVTALGVGIGVDYALYLLSVQLVLQRNGASLREAYRGAVTFTGKVVLLVGLTLSAAVATWIWSPIKFQADMGTLLAFMFLWNMLGALILLPALSYFLLPASKLGKQARSPAANVIDAPGPESKLKLHGSPDASIPNTQNRFAA